MVNGLRHHFFPVISIIMTRSLDNVVVFDGVCNLCAHSVKFNLSHEENQILRFAPLQSPAGERLMKVLGFDPNDAKTFVLIADGRAYVRSDAAIRVSRYLSGAWKLLWVLKIIPRPVRDWAYDVVAKNRYRWFGRMESCMVPTPELRSRFIHE